MAQDTWHSGICSLQKALAYLPTLLSEQNRNMSGDIWKQMKLCGSLQGPLSQLVSLGGVATFPGGARQFAQQITSDIVTGNLRCSESQHY